MGIIADLKRRLFRWRSDGTAPLRLAQRRIFILPTRAGLLFAAALLAMLTGAINYNLALGHALVFLLAGLALVGMVIRAIKSEIPTIEQLRLPQLFKELIMEPRGLILVVGATGFWQDRRV